MDIAREVVTTDNIVKSKPELVPNCHQTDKLSATLDWHTQTLARDDAG